MEVRARDILDFTLIGAGEDDVKEVVELLHIHPDSSDYDTGNSPLPLLEHHERTL